MLRLPSLRFLTAAICVATSSVSGLKGNADNLVVTNISPVDKINTPLDYKSPLPSLDNLNSKNISWYLPIPASENNDLSLNTLPPGNLSKHSNDTSQINISAEKSTIQPFPSLGLEKISFNTAIDLHIPDHRSLIPGLTASLNSQQIDLSRATTISKKNDSLRNAVEIKYGVFSSGFWAPVQPQNGISDWKYDSCNAFFFCSPDGLYGGILEIKYIRRLATTGRHHFDLDSSVGFGWQSPVIKNSTSLDKTYVASPKSGNQQFFGKFSLVPTYRYQLNSWLSLGIGAGIDYSSTDPQNIDSNSFNAASNVEISLKPTSNKSLEFTFAFQHRCAFFGTLNEDGANTGSNWYAAGLRKWF